MDTLKFYFYYFDSLFTGFAPIIRITVFAVMLLSLLYITFLFRLFIIQNKIKRKKKRWEHLKQTYRQKINRIIYAPYNMDQEEIAEEMGIRINTFKKRWQKENLSKLILYVKNEEEKNKEKDISSLNDNNYRTLLDLFRINKYWLKELSNRNIRRKKKALRMLDELSYTQISSYLTPLLQHKDEELRKLSRSVFVKFDSHDPYKFMEENFDKKFNRLDEIRVHDALIQKSKEHKLPLLTHWMQEAQNIAYRCFLIKEIAIFKQYDSIPYLLALFKKSKDNKEKAEIVNTIGALNHTEALPFFISEYALNPKVVQLSIIKAIGILGERENIPFLHKEYKESYNNELQEEIAKAIRRLQEKEENEATEENSKFKPMYPFHAI